MYEHNGEKYFVVDSHLHFWDASPANWVKGQEQFAEGWINCFHAYMGLAPPETHWPIEKFQKYSEEDFVKDVFEDGYVDVGCSSPTYLKQWYIDGFNTAERNARMAEKYPDKLIVNGRWDPRDGDAGLKGARGRRQALWPQGRQALHGRMAQRLAWVEAHGPGGGAVPGEVPGARDQEHPRAQGPDDLAARQGRLRRLRRRPRGDGLPRAQLHRRARGAAADRGLLLHGDAGAERLRGPGGRDRWVDARPSALLRQGHGRAALLGRRGQDAVGQRLRHLGAQVAGRGLRRLELPADEAYSDYPALDTAEEEDHGPQRGQAVRHRGPAGAAAAARRGREPAARDDAQLVEDRA